MVLGTLYTLWNVKECIKKYTRYQSTIHEQKGESEGNFATVLIYDTNWSQEYRFQSFWCVWTQCTHWRKFKGQFLLRIWELQISTSTTVSTVKLVATQKTNGISSFKMAQFSISCQMLPIVFLISTAWNSWTKLVRVISLWGE